jgi:hypothetical protein
MAGPSPHSTESTCPAEQAWRHTTRHGAPLQLHVFLVCYNDFSFSPSQNHVFCMVFCPHVLFQCILTRKTCHALPSLGTPLLLPQLLLLLLLLLLPMLLLLLLLSTTTTDCLNLAPPYFRAVGVLVVLLEILVLLLGRLLVLLPRLSLAPRVLLVLTLLLVLLVLVPVLAPALVLVLVLVLVSVLVLMLMLVLLC